MGRNDIRLRRNKISSRRIDRYRNYGELMSRHEQNQKIKAANAEIDTLTEETYALEAEYRKLEAEVGPVKYIAEMIYGEADRDLLEEAVRWVIIIIVVVFDPLAIMMLLAATESFGWAKEQRNERRQDEFTGTNPHGGIHDSDEDRQTEPDSNSDETTNENAEEELSRQVDRTGDSSDTAVDTASTETDGKVDQEVEEPQQKIVFPEPEPFDPEEFQEEIDNETNQYQQVLTESVPDDNLDSLVIDEEEFSQEINSGKLAKKIWKAQNADDTLKRQQRLLENGVIDQVPWEKLKPVADDLVAGNISFGIKFPDNVSKGDTFIRVDYLPTKLYKFNGSSWIEVNKEYSDSFTYNEEYIDHLIEKLGSGEYDPDMLNDKDSEQIEKILKD